MIFTAKEISERLSQRAEAVAEYLLPGGMRKGSEWVCGSIDGEKGESLKIRISGSKLGVWSDFATGEAGDILSLWCLKRHLTTYKAILEAMEWLGCGSREIGGSTGKFFKTPVLKNDLEFSDYLCDERKIKKTTQEIFGVGQANDEIIFPYWRDGKIVLIKYLKKDRPNGKKIIHVEANCEPCLFGWKAIDVCGKNIREITLCEGEIDAMSLHQYGWAALSVPFGGGKGAKHQWLEYECERLAIFDKIYLCLDNDAEGNAAVCDLIDRLGRSRCVIVTLPYKDANMCLQAQIKKEEIDLCFDNAKSLDPEELKSARDFANETYEKLHPSGGYIVGVRSPWEKVGDKILFRPNELSVWTGINGHGKSQFLGQIILQTIKHGGKVCIASLELNRARLLARLNRQAGAMRAPSREYNEAIHEWYKDKLWVFDVTGTAKSDRLLDVFKYARQKYGVDTFVIDSFMRLEFSEDDYNGQKVFIQKLCDFKNEYNCHVHLIVHPRKPPDEYSPPSKLSSKGSGSVSDLADNCFSIWRNKRKQEKIQECENQGQFIPEDLSSQCDALWTCDKQRYGEWEGKIGLWFEPESFQFLGYQSQKPIRYVQFSNKVPLSSADQGA